jgi:hypothetical protein
MENKFDSMSFCSRRLVYRRRVEDRRLFLKQEYPDHKLERRVNIIKRRMLGNRRKLLPEIMDTFWKKVL